MIEVERYNSIVIDVAVCLNLSDTARTNYFRSNVLPPHPRPGKSSDWRRRGNMAVPIMNAQETFESMPKKTCDPAIELRPHHSYSNDVLESMLWDMSDTPEKRGTVEEKTTSCISKASTRWCFPVAKTREVSYSKEALQAMLFDLSDAPEKQELLSKKETSVGFGTRMIDAELDQQPHKKLKKNWFDIYYS